MKDKKKSKKTKESEIEVISYGKDKLLRADAEEIYRRFTAEEFDLNKRARKIEVEYNHNDRNEETGKVIRKLKINGVLADNFSDAISAYQIQRGSAYWNEVAHDLVLAYNDLRTNDCLVPGNEIKKQLEERHELEEENGRLKETIADLERRMNNMFEVCPKCEYSLRGPGPDYTTTVGSGQ